MRLTPTMAFGTLPRGLLFRTTGSAAFSIENQSWSKTRGWILDDLPRGVPTVGIDRMIDALRIDKLGY